MFLAVLFFAPLAFGTVHVWSRGVMEVLCVLSLVLLLVDHAMNRTPLYRPPGMLPLLLFLGYTLFQVIPLPALVVKTLSPATFAIYQQTVGVFDPLNWMSLSLQRRATLSEFFRYVAYTCFYFLAVQLLSDGRFLKKAVHLLIAFGALLAAVAMLQHVTSPDRIFWFHRTFRASPFGPYFNRNHWAGLMEMLFPLAMGMFLYRKPRVVYQNLRQRLVEFFNAPGVNLYFLLGLAALLMGVSVFVSLSRGGILSLSLSLCLMGALLTLHRETRARGKMIIAIFTLLLISVGWFGWQPIFQRFAKARDLRGNITESRLQIWADSTAMARGFSATGTGMGTFAEVYSAYYHTAPEKNIRHAHNDYLELVTDGGLPALLLAGWFVFSIFVTFRLFRRRREPFCVYLYIGALSGFAAILLHSITDFNLHIGANGLYFFLLAALCVSAASTRLRFRSTGSLLPPARFSEWYATLLPAGLLLITCIFFNGHALLSDAKTVPPVSAQAIEYYQQAVRQSPANAVYLPPLAQLFDEQGDKKRAEQLFQAAVHRDIRSADYRAVYSLWLIENGRKEAGLEMMQAALALSPRRTKSYVQELEGLNISHREILQALPERVAPYMAYAGHLDEAKKPELAESVYRRALAYLPNEETVKTGPIYKLYHRYLKQKRIEDALDVINQGLKYLPDNPGLHVTAARLYEKLNITYRAIEEYKKALVLDPKNRTAKSRLKKLTS